MSTTLTRADLVNALNNNPKVVLAFEQLFSAVVENTTALTTGAAATGAINDATVLTLSPNDTFTNERVVAAGQGIRLNDTGSALVISMLANIAMNGTSRLTFNLIADASLSVIQSGTVMVKENPVANLGNYANDAAAAGGGVPVGGLYRNANAVQIRVA